MLVSADGVAVNTTRKRCIGRRSPKDNGGMQGKGVKVIMHIISFNYRIVRLKEAHGIDSISSTI